MAAGLDRLEDLDGGEVCVKASRGSSYKVVRRANVVGLRNGGCGDNACRRQNDRLNWLLGGVVCYRDDIRRRHFDRSRAWRRRRLCRYSGGNTNIVKERE